jgi:hypothetical protein
MAMAKDKETSRAKKLLATYLGRSSFGSPGFFVAATLCTTVLGLTALEHVPAHHQEMRWETGVLAPVIMAFVLPMCGVMLNVLRWNELSKPQRILIVVLVVSIPLLWLVLGHPYRHPREV